MVGLIEDLTTTLAEVPRLSTTDDDLDRLAALEIDVRKRSEDLEKLADLARERVRGQRKPAKPNSGIARA